MSATANFATRWRRGGRSAAVLVQMDLLAAAQAAVTLYASHGVIGTPNGVWWEPLLQDVEPLNAPGSLGTSDVPLCTTRIRLARKKVSSQAGETDLLHGLFSGRSVIGSTVTIWLWETGLTQWADALQVFTGRVQDYEVRAEYVLLNLRQRANWNRPMPNRSLDASIYVRAPEDGRGAPLPVAYGKVLGPALRPPQTPVYDVLQRRLEMLRGPSGLSRGALVDSGRGGTARPKVLGAAHQCVSLFDPNAGSAVWLDSEGHMQLVNAQAVDTINTSTEAGIFINDDQDAFVMVPFSEIVPGVTNPARNPRYVLEPNDATFAEMNPSLFERDLRVNLSSMPDLGFVTGFAAGVCYESNGTGMTLYVYKDADTATQQVMTTMPLSSTPILVESPFFPFGSGVFTHLWDGFGNYTLRITWASFPNVVARIYFKYLMIRYNMRRKVVRAAHLVSSTRKRPTFRKRQGPFLVPMGFGPYDEFDEVPAVTELVGDYYWNLRAMADGSPLVTGVPSALVERGPDVYAHVLGRFGGDLPGGAVEAGVGAFGSYIDARADMMTWNKKEMTFAFTLSETADVMTVLSWLAASTLSFIYLDRFTDRWHIVPWRTDRAANWFFKFTPREVNEFVPECRMTPDSSVVTGLRVRYGWNAREGAFRYETAIGAGRSSAGHRYSNLRDETVSVIFNVNDRIDFVTSATFAATLASGSYATPALLAEQAQTQLNIADPDVSRDHFCSFSGVVTLNHNDRILISDGLTRTLTLDPGTYTMEQLAAHLQTKILAVSTNWTVTYSRTTGKFTIARSAGTAQIQFGTGLRNGCMLFGFRPVTVTGQQSYVGDVAIEEHRFVFATSGGTIALNWGTGVSGSEAVTPRTAASLFGFDPRFNSGAAVIHVGPCPKGTREATIAAAEALYGARREATYEARCVYDGDTARELRNRIMDLYVKPRLRIEFTTDHAPDLERGRVIEFSGDFDAAMPYPEPGTDGTWEGKRFVVVETEQHLGPTAFYTRVVAVSINPGVLAGGGGGGGWGFDWGNNWSIVA